jgi:NAD(P)-dependent dehydrogenase (short-subunit alcohol dehydrogenase family)
MRERKQGCIINIASRAGTVNTPFAGAYSTGKAGLIRLTACLQAELAVDGFGDSIHVYALHPGAVKTDMTRKCLKRHRCLWTAAD